MSALRCGIRSASRKPGPVKIVSGRAARKIANKAAHAEARRHRNDLSFGEPNPANAEFISVPL